MTITLRDYQQAAVDAVIGRTGRLLIEAPTGAGKSLIAAEIMRRTEGRVVLLSHVRELVAQDASAYEALTQQSDYSILCASLDARGSGDDRLIFGSVQTVVRRLDRITPPDTVIIDEAHLLSPRATSQYQTILRRWQPRLLIGLTATPYRLDCGRLDKGKDQLFDEIAYRIAYRTLVDRGVLVEPVFPDETPEQIDTRAMKIAGGEFTAASLNTIADDPAFNTRMAAQILALSEGRRAVLVFTASLRHNRLLRDIFARLGASVDIVDGTMGKVQRQEALAGFLEGRTRVLLNCAVLTTGFDFPALDCIALARPTMSTGLYVQMLGRGLRAAPGKSDCLILDYGGNLARHGDLDCVTPRTMSEPRPRALPKRSPEELAPVPRDAPRLDAYPRTRQRKGNIVLEDIYSWRLRYHRGKIFTCVRVDYHTRDGHAFSIFLAPQWGDKWLKFWRLHGGPEPVPRSVFEMLRRKTEIRPAARMRISYRDKYPRIVSVATQYRHPAAMDRHDRDMA